MAGTGISETMMFSAAVILAIAFVGVFGVVVGDAGRDLTDQGNSVSDQLRTDIVILNDPGDMDSPLVLYARNIGDATIQVNQTAVFLDGQPAGTLAYDVLGSADDSIWTPGTTIEITATDLSFGSGAHHARIVTASGVEANLSFVV